MGGQGTRFRTLYLDYNLTGQKTLNTICFDDESKELGCLRYRRLALLRVLSSEKCLFMKCPRSSERRAFSIPNARSGIIAVVATKNRVGLLPKALESISLQRKAPLEVIVVSDSNDDFVAQEKQLCSQYGFVYLRDRYSHNYAGNLNTAIEDIVARYLYDQQWDPNNLYIAFLDDDDFWSQDYLRECWNACIGESDIVVCGIEYHSDDKVFKLSIPTYLNVDCFLEGNPHIQGSNTFVRLSLLLKAGCFDENMKSTTDRDLFTRLFLLNPKYSIVDKYLVTVDAPKSRPRLTNNVVDKGFSLAQFYSKYGGLMSDAVKNRFFNRARRFNPNIDEQSILQYFDQRDSIDVFFRETTVESIDIEKLPRLCFSFATTDIRYGLRLLSDINASDYPSKKVIVFANFESASDLGVFEEKIREYGIDGVILELNTALVEASMGNYGTFVKENVHLSGMIGDIAVVRTILQQFTFKNTSNGDAIYVLDDDMRLATIERIDGKFEEEKVDLKRFVFEYLGKADAVIGSYAGDAPLPSLSTLRTSLLDYVYAKKLRKNLLVRSDTYDVSDYYYAFSDLGNVAIETPLPLLVDCTIEDVLGGMAVSRPLYRKRPFSAAPSRRGGNTLIFNRNLLLLPNVSIKISDVVARRGDSLWMIVAERMGFRISVSSFALNQSRIIGNFDFKKELHKEMADIIGYAAVCSIERNGLDSRTKFSCDFQGAIRNRTVRFAVSYFRIIGLLQMLGDHELDYMMQSDVIYRFIQKIREKSDISFVEAGFDGLRSDIGHLEKRNLVPDIVSFLRDECGYSDVVFLGFGHEGAVFALGETTIKVFFQKEGLRFFKENVSLLKEVVGLPSNISFSDGGRYAFCSYSTILNVQPYEGGHAVELANLLYSLKRRGLTIRNLKKENMIVSKDKLYFIDLGKDIIPYSESAYDEAVERGYQAIEYASLSESDFRVIVSRSHHLDAEALNFNLPVFAELARNRHKEQIHDPLVIELIEKHHPSSLLDYGAGKCKIANALSSSMDVFVFDVDLKTLRERASNSITVIDDIGKVNRQFDLVNCNKVLCCVDEKYLRLHPR